MTTLEIKTRGKELSRMSAPVMVEQSFIILMGLISSILVASVGEHAVAAVSLVDTISNTIIAFFAALTTGGTIVIAQYVGKNDVGKVKLVAGQTVFLSVLVSVVVLIVFAFFGQVTINLAFAAADPNVKSAAHQFLFISMFSYPFVAVMQTNFGILRGVGDARTPMFISILMNIVNLIFGLILIPPFGVAGAAVGLLIARAVGCVASGYYVVFRSKLIRLNKFSLFKPDFEPQKAILRFGLPTSVESILFQLGKIIVTMMVVGMSTSAVTANAIAWTLVGIINVAGTGFATGVMVLCGQKVGRGEVEDIKRTTLFASIVNMAAMASVCLILFILFEPIAILYNLEPETHRYLQQLMFSVFIASILLWPWSFIIPSVLRATGDVMYAMLVSIITMWGARIVLGYVLGVVLGFGVFGVWVGMYVDWTLRGIFYSFRLLSGKWKGKGVKN